MIVAGMNALVRRSCAWTPVRTLASTANHGGPGNKYRQKGGKPQRQGGKLKAQAETKPAAEPKTIPLLKTKLPPQQRPAQPAQPKPVPAPLETPNEEKRAHVPLPSPNPPLAAYSLSPSQLRALIDLYHSSTSFITPETLENAIDETFAPLRLAFNTNTRYQSYRDLVAQRDEMDAEPDRVVPSANDLSGLGYGTADSLGGELSGWSTSKGERVRMVKAALWGVDPLARIGLETLLEAKVELDGQDKENEDK